MTAQAATDTERFSSFSDHTSRNDYGPTRQIDALGATSGKIVWRLFK